MKQIEQMERYRWNNYKINSRNYDCIQPYMQKNMNITKALVTVDF